MQDTASSGQKIGEGTWTQFEIGSNETVCGIFGTTDSGDLCDWGVVLAGI